MLYKYFIQGQKPLHGNVNISGSKNSSLAILNASIMINGKIILDNIPNVQDVTFMLNILQNLSSKITLDSEKPHYQMGKKIILDQENLKNTNINYDFVKKMRASIFTIGPLLSRFGEATVSLPGGCTIGERGIDLHVMALKALGAEITIDNGYVHAKAHKQLQGAYIKFPKSSVGATQNAISGAIFANGETIIENAASDKEVLDMIDFLNHLGAKISWIEQNKLIIKGINSLNSRTFTIPYDRLEIGTYAVYAAITDGNLLLNNCTLDYLNTVKDVFDKIGIECTQEEGGIRCKRKDKNLHACDIVTMPNNGFPTDLQAITSIALCIANGGPSKITENIFENRFMHVPELIRLGANIDIIDNHNIIINPVKELHAAPVMSTDLRASAALIGAGLIAKGKTIVDRIYLLERGYEHMSIKLKNCGADIQKKYL